MDKNIIKASGLMYSLNEHYLNHLIRIYKAFNGDLELCIVLGEIGHYNTRKVFLDKSTIKLDLNKIRKTYTGCNASSISMTSRIPRQTVRRKIKKLEEMGYVTINDKKQIVITDLPHKHFGEFTKESLKIFMQFIDEMKTDKFI